MANFNIKFETFFITLNKFSSFVFHQKGTATMYSIGIYWSV